MRVSSLLVSHVQIDLNGAMNMSHVAALPHCHFHYADVFTAEAKELIATAAAKASKAVMLGTHLCGMLSPRLIEIFSEV